MRQGGEKSYVQFRRLVSVRDRRSPLQFQGEDQGQDSRRMARTLCFRVKQAAK